MNTTRTMTTTLRFALVAGLGTLMLGACATRLEPDPRLDAARAALSAAQASGTASAQELADAQGYLVETETAFEKGRRKPYDHALALTEGYTELAVTKGDLASATAKAGELETSLAAVRTEAETCNADLAEANAALSAMRSEVLSEALGASSVETTPEGTKYVLQSVTFGSGSANLTAAGRERLDALVEHLASNAATATITGHTDAQGGDEANQALSLRRAEAVVAYLTGEGIDAARLTASGAGETAPIADNATSAGRSQNRRVELMLAY